MKEEKLLSKGQLSSDIKNSNQLVLTLAYSGSMMALLVKSIPKKLIISYFV